MTADNISRMMPGSFPSTPDSPSSRSYSEDTNEQYLANENEVSISTTLLRDLMTILTQDSELTEQIPAETIATTPSGMFCSAGPDDKIILNADEVGTLLKQSLSMLQALEMQCAMMKEASKELVKEQEEKEEELQEGVSATLQDTLIANDLISSLDLDGAMGEVHLCNGKA